MNYLLFPVDGGIHSWYVCPLVTWLCIIACHREKYMSELYIESPECLPIDSFIMQTLLFPCH